MANFWCGMQCLAVQMSSLVSSEMWKWIRMSRFSYPEEEKKKRKKIHFSPHSVWSCACALFCSPELSRMSRIFCTRALLLRAVWKRVVFLCMSRKAGPLCFVYSFFTVSTHFTLIWSREKNTSIFHKRHFWFPGWRNLKSIDHAASSWRRDTQQGRQR